MIALVIVTYALLASTFTIGKTTLFYAKPFFLVGFRMVVAGILMLGYRALFQKKRFAIKKHDIWPFIKVIITHVYITFMFEYWALQYVSSAKTVVIYASTPFIAAILSYALLNESFSFRKTIAMGFGILSLVPILATHESLESFSGSFFSLSLPEGVLLISVFCACYAWFVIKELMEKNYSLLFINGFSMFIGGIACLLTSFVFEGFTPSPVYDWPHFLFWVLVLVVVANIIFYNLYGWLLKRYTITFMTFAGFLTPIFGSFYGWFFLGEVITWHYYAALACVGVGLTLFYWEEWEAS